MAAKGARANGSECPQMPADTAQMACLGDSMQHGNNRKLKRRAYGRKASPRKRQRTKPAQMAARLLRAKGSERSPRKWQRDDPRKWQRGQSAH